MVLNVNMKVILFILASLNRLAVAEENKIFLYNRIEFCKPNELFDVNFFKCVPCDSNLNLMVADDCEFSYRFFLNLLSLILFITDAI